MEKDKKRFDTHSMPWAVENKTFENENLIGEPEPEFWSSEEWIDSLKNSANNDFYSKTQILRDDENEDIPF